MGSFSVWHWVIVLIVVLVVFGTGKLRNIGKDLGGAIKDFKKGMNEGEGAKEGNSSANLTQGEASNASIETQKTKTP